MKLTLTYLIFLLIFLSCGSDDDNVSKVTESPQEEQEVALEFILDRSDVIWGFDFLPENRIIFTERSGGIFILQRSSSEVTSVSNVPEVSAVGEGGMLDIELHPNFSSNNQIYFCYTGEIADGRNIVLGRGTLDGTTLTSVETIFTTNEVNNSSIHFGCRIEFQDQESLFLSVGDQSEPSQAQNPDSYLGKILRMSDEGEMVEVFSLGHRNVQGLAIRPENGELYASEHGPTGGDELNLILEGENYGWPLVTTGEPEGPLGDSDPRYVDPLATWTPAIAPSGITFYSGEQISEWRGDLFIATLRGNHIRRISLENQEVVNQEILFGGRDIRFRNIKEGPDGFLYFSTDDGKLGRIIGN